MQNGAIATADLDQPIETPAGTVQEVTERVDRKRVLFLKDAEAILRKVFVERVSRPALPIGRQRLFNPACVAVRVRAPKAGIEDRTLQLLGA